MAVGAERHARDGASMSVEGESFLAGPDIPHLDRVPTGQRRAALPSGLNATLFTPERSPSKRSLPAPWRRPTPSSSRRSGGGEPPAVGAERHALDRGRYALEGEGFPPGPGVPPSPPRTAGGDRLPSGLNATLSTPIGMLLEGEGFLSGGASQTFTVPSQLAEASRLPSGLNATLRATLACPLRVRVSCPVTASHTFTVPSLPPGEPLAVGAERHARNAGDRVHLSVKEIPARSRHPTPSPSSSARRRRAACRRG